MIRTKPRLADLYDLDETAWLEATAERIRRGAYDELDFAHLAEYLTDMAIRDRREVESRLVVLLSHILKWEFQRGRRVKSWSRTIIIQQQELETLIGGGVLRQHAYTALDKCYGNAVKRAALETDLPIKNFPVKCPYSVDQLLTFDVIGTAK